MIDKFDVIEGLSECGVTITDRALLRWERAGLIPEGSRTNLGRGQGIRSEYPNETIAEAYATWQLLHGEVRTTPKNLSEIRLVALDAEPHGGIGGTLLAEVHDGKRPWFHGLLAQEWLKHKHRVLTHDAAACDVCRNLA